MSAPLLAVRGLGVDYAGAQGLRPALGLVDFELRAGGTLALVGESGSGKTQTALAVVGLLGPGARTRGSVRFQGRELLGAPEEQARLRGDRIGLVFQDPMSALNPSLRIGEQLAEVLEVHRGSSRAGAEAEAARMLEAVRIADARARLRSYPHELSGGMRQRVLIAAALMARPQLLIADEPTTALDVTVQAQILALLAELQRAMDMALLLITHDLGVVEQACDHLLVLYAGRSVETGPCAQVLRAPMHPYTQGLLRARPRLHGPVGPPQPIPGSPASAARRGAGCAFAPRCAQALARCGGQEPDWRSSGDRGWACWLQPVRARGGA